MQCDHFSPLAVWQPQSHRPQATRAARTVPMLRRLFAPRGIVRSVRALLTARSTGSRFATPRTTLAWGAGSARGVALDSKNREGTTAAPSRPSDATLDDRRKRALWRCKQRGWVEIDLLMGNWASEAIPKMSVDDLEDLEIIIEQENPNLLNWLLGNEQVPEDLKSNTMESMIAYVTEGKKNWTVGGNQ